MPVFTDDTLVPPRDLGDRDDPNAVFTRSYLTIRATVGIIGVALPFVFIIGEGFFLRGGVHVRGSLSAYYHTTMRDYFVGGLAVVGVLLATYMAGQSRRTDFKLSLVSGLAVLGVAFFPTKRPSLPDGAPLCGTVPEPTGCSPMQQYWGETEVAMIHFASAGVFILSLAATCFYFAYREREKHGNPGMAKIQIICGCLILAAVAWAVVGGWLGLDIGELTPLYIGEVVAVWAFGASWLLNGREIWRAVFSRRSAQVEDGGASPATTSR
jgi:hypothetical protein